MKHESSTPQTEHKQSSPQSPLVVITRIFQAPVEWVWKAWTDPEIVEQWWGPSGYMSKYACMEFREGGKYFLDMEGRDGSLVWVTGTYEEIDPHKKIVCTQSYADKEGNIISPNDIGIPGNWAQKLYITIEFEELEPYQTKMVVSHEGIPQIRHAKATEDWHQSLDKFSEVVERYGDENLNMIQ